MGSGAVLVAQALAVAIAVALGLALWIVLRKAGRLIAETRRIEGFQRATGDLVERIAASLDGVSTGIDAVRRHSIPADEIADNITAATEAVQRYTDEARALKGPPDGAGIRDAIVAELGRAERALQMVEHGRSILTSARVGGRELEAQTSIKRGYLNLLHAREAIERHAARVADLHVSDDVQWFHRRNA